MYTGIKIECRGIFSLKECKPDDSEMTSLNC